MSKKEELVLLGIWNVPPVESWGWFCREAVDHLFDLTGIKLRVVTMIKEGLHHECFFQKDVQSMKNALEKMSDEDQVIFMEKLCDDYYHHAGKMQKFLDSYDLIDFSTYTNRKLNDFIERLSQLWPHVAMQIWYVVLLDIWYPSPEEKVELKVMGGKARDNLGNMHELSNTIEEKVYIEAAKRLSMQLESIKYLFPHEIIHALRTETNFEKLATSRRELCVTVTFDDEHKIYHGAEAEKILNTYDVPQEGKNKKTLLKGTSANNGRVRGRARIIKRNDEFANFEEGEVLVTLQTMVHYLPLMKKSKAILTEFGGLTSHAAIVSRELKKPCIVGISNLIASVEDGDMVEVDADRGVVKINKKT